MDTDKGKWSESYLCADALNVTVRWRLSASNWFTSLLWQWLGLVIEIDWLQGEVDNRQRIDTKGD